VNLQETTMRSDFRKGVGRGAALLILAPFLAGGLCSDVTGVAAPGEYTLVWQFENNYCESATFLATYADLEQVRANVGSGDNSTVETFSEYRGSPTHVTVVATTSTGTTTGSGDVVIASNRRTTVNVTLLVDGQVSISTLAPTTSIAATAAPACVAPKTTWTLVGITGPTTVNVSDQYASATGRLVLNVPQTVTEGSTVSVSATYTATVTAAPGWSPRIELSAGLVDRDPFGVLQTSNVVNLGIANPTVTGSATVTANWIIPPNRPLMLKLEAGGQVHSGGPPGSTLNLVATYARSP
jgi:hypothetical protein